MITFGTYGYTGGVGPKNTIWKIGFGHECFGKSICRHPFNEVCSGHGKCVNWNQCACDEGYYGSECQFSSSSTICFGKESTDPTVCSGNGTCIANDTCSCNEEYYGQECELECPTPAIISSRYTIDATKIRILFNIEMNTQMISCSDLFQDANKLGVNA